jgi:chromosome partitioning protein
MTVSVVTMLNQKGGVGKTSVCHNLAGALAASGRRVLLVDNDPQSSLTQGLWGPPATEALDPAETVHGLYDGRGIVARCVHKTDDPRIDLIPGSQAAEHFNVPDPWDADRDWQVAIREAVEEVKGDYAIVLIDCPPNLHLCSWASLVASDRIIVPLQAEDYGAQGIPHIRRSIALVQGGANPGLELIGYLFNRVKLTTSVHRDYIALMREMYGDLVLETTIPDATDFVDAIRRRKTVLQHKPKGKGATAIRALADEVLAKLELRDVAGEAA